MNRHYTTRNKNKNTLARSFWWYLISVFVAGCANISARAPPIFRVPTQSNRTHQRRIPSHTLFNILCYVALHYVMLRYIVNFKPNDAAGLWWWFSMLPIVLFSCNLSYLQWVVGILSICCVEVIFLILCITFGACMLLHSGSEHIKHITHN